MGSGFRVPETTLHILRPNWNKRHRSWILWGYRMPQSHPTTDPERFLSPVRYLARKAEWSARRNFTSVLFSWSHQATDPVRLDTTVYLLGERQEAHILKFNAPPPPPPTHLVCHVHLIANFLSFHMSLVVVVNCGAGNALRGFEKSVF